MGKIRILPHDVECCDCGKTYHYIPQEKHGHTATRCNACVSNKHRRERKAKAVQYLGGKCSVCGYERCQAALQFHHINPVDKSFEISMYKTSWEKTRSELDKCVLLCANCHAEVEAGFMVL